MDRMVDRISRFFLYTLPSSQTKGPFPGPALEDMFREAMFCQEASNSLAQDMRRILQPLEAKWQLCQATKLLFVALCDNVRVNSASLEVARRLYDGSTEDLETWLCAQQRGSLREVFMTASEAVKGSSNWPLLKSYLLLVDLQRMEIGGRGQARVQAKLNSLLKESPDKLLSSLLVEQEEVASSQGQVLALVSRGADLQTLLLCDKDLLARVCVAREEVLGLTMRILAQAVAGQPTMEEILQVCSVACPLASSPHLSPTKVLDSLDSALTNHTAFVRAEILNILSAKLL